MQKEITLYAVTSCSNLFEYDWRMLLYASDLLYMTWYRQFDNIKIVFCASSESEKSFLLRPMLLQSSKFLLAFVFFVLVSVSFFINTFPRSSFPHYRTIFWSIDQKDYRLCIYWYQLLMYLHPFSRMC